MPTIKLIKSFTHEDAIEFFYEYSDFDLLVTPQSNTDLYDISFSGTDEDYEKFNTKISQENKKTMNSINTDKTKAIKTAIQEIIELKDEESEKNSAIASLKNAASPLQKRIEELSLELNRVKNELNLLVGDIRNIEEERKVAIASRVEREARLAQVYDLPSKIVTTTHQGTNYNVFIGDKQVVIERQEQI